MHRRERQQLQAGMVVFVVVPVEEVPAERIGVWNATESVRVTWPILQGFEVRLRERVVAGDMGSAMNLGGAKIANSNAGDRAVIGPPRSAWMFSCPGTIFCCWQACSINCFARPAL